MEPQKPGNSPGPGPEVVETTIAEDRAVQRVRSWTVQDERCPGTSVCRPAGRILDFANLKEIRA